MLAARKPDPRCCHPRNVATSQHVENPGVVPPMAMRVRPGHVRLNGVWCEVQTQQSSLRGVKSPATCMVQVPRHDLATAHIEVARKVAANGGPWMRQGLKLNGSSRVFALACSVVMSDGRGHFGQSEAEIVAPV